MDENNTPQPHVFYWDGHYDEIIVIPSISLDEREVEKVFKPYYYEERMLYHLLLINKKTSTNVIFITSLPLDVNIVRVYWKCIAEQDRPSWEEFSDRLKLHTANDHAPKCLSKKLLERPRLLQRIGRQIRNPDKACVVCFISTKHEHEIATKWKLPLIAPHHRLAHHGSKSGSRLIFEECDVPLPVGTDLVFSPTDLAHKIADLVCEHPYISKMVVKLNESFSGTGNAILHIDQNIVYSVREFPNRHSTLREHIEQQLCVMEFQGREESWEPYSMQMRNLGVLAESFVHNAIHAPSCQAIVDVHGDVKIMSTHEQLLQGHTFLGCKFPCNSSYRNQVHEYTIRVGKALGAKGVVDFFSVDYLAVPSNSEDEFKLYALEINLRRGGTTHPFMVLSILTGGNYNTTTGEFETPSGSYKYYVATDNLVANNYMGLLPDDVKEILSKSTNGGDDQLSEKKGLLFRDDTQTGVVVHLVGPLSEFGKMGMTCIGNTMEEAQALYEEAVRLLDDESRNLRM